MISAKNILKQGLVILKRYATLYRSACVQPDHTAEV